MKCITGILLIVFCAVMLVPSVMTHGAPAFSEADTSLAETRAAWQFSFAPVFQVSGGRTEYEIRFQEYVRLETGNDSVLVRGRSKLEFPLDAVRSGGEFAVTRTEDGLTRFQARVRALFAMADPGGDMRDHDWLTVPAFQFDREYQYTESRAEGSWLSLMTEFTYLWSHHRQFDLYWRAGFEYQHIRQNAIDYDGWSYDIVADREAPISGKGEVIEYRVNYFLPQAGLAGYWYPNSRLTIETWAALVLAFADDRDDHVLRHKVSESSARGVGVSGAVFGRWSFAPRGSSVPFVGLGLELLSVTTNGTQEQLWYDDEVMYNPDTQQEEVAVPKGTESSGIDYEANTSQWRLVLKAGLSF